MCVRACHVRRQHLALPCTLSRTALNASRHLEGTEIICRWFRPWCCDTGSSSHFTKLVTSSDPHGPSVTDPRLTRCQRCSHPHVHHTLACSLVGLHTSSLVRFFPCALQLSLSFSFSSPSYSFSLVFFLVLFSLFLLLSPQNGPPIRFISAARLSGRRVCPSSPHPTCARLP